MLNAALYREVVDFLGGSTRYPLADTGDKAVLVALLKFVSSEDESDVFESIEGLDYHRRKILVETADYLWKYGRLTLLERQRLASLWHVLSD